MPSYVPWTAPTAGVHPRLYVTPSTITALRTKAFGTHLAYWNALISYCDGRLNTTLYPNSKYLAQDPEYGAALAFAYLLDNTKTAYAERAKQIAIYLCDESTYDLSDDDGRLQMGCLAMIYDWAYGYLDTTTRATIRATLDTYIQAFKDVSAVEYLWGHSHGGVTWSQVALAAIIRDDASKDATYNGWMDQMMNEHEDGTDECYFGIWRYFSQGEGGTYKGCGPMGYDTRSEDFYVRYIPAMESALGLNWFNDQAWFFDRLKWKLWHWRGDRTFHRQNENRAFSQYTAYTQIHALQYAFKKPSDVLAPIAMWLDNEIHTTNNSIIWGPYQIYNILYRDLTVQAARVRPTIATMGGSMLKHFVRAGKVIIREGWAESGLSIAISSPKFFTGDHQKRDAGSFELCYNGSTLVFQGGSYRAQAQTYKIPGAVAGGETGHRWSYAARIPAQNVCRIHSAAEQAQNMVDSFQRSGSATSRFGVWNGTSVNVSNDGGQLWPKSASNVYQPGTLAELLAEPKWNFDGVVHANDGTDLVHVVTDITDWYWSGKCSLYRRHWVVVKAGRIPGWSYPILIIFDDLLTTVDPVKQNQTQVYQLQLPAAPVRVGNEVRVTRVNSRYFHTTLAPAVNFAFHNQQESVGGPTVEGEPYIVDQRGTWDDAWWNNTVQHYRMEITPAVAGGQQQFVNVMALCPSNIAAGPTLELVPDAGYIHILINGVKVRIKKGGAPYSALFGEDETPPDPPPDQSGEFDKLRTSLYSGLALSAGGGPTTSAWQDVSDSFNTDVSLKLTNGTGLTQAPEVDIEVAGDDAGPAYRLKNPFRGTKTSSDQKSIVIRLPLGANFFRLVIRHPLGGSAQLDAEFTQTLMLTP